MSELHARIPYIDLVKQNAVVLDDAISRIRKVLEHGHAILGPEVHELEEKLERYLGVNHVIGVNSGTDALVLALRAHDIGPGDEVVTASHTFLATACAICVVGAIPVFADLDPDTMLVSPASIEAQITEKTKAVIPVHLNGYPCDMDALEGIASAHDLILIEDAAQSIGAQRGGRSTGTWGTGCFSLHPLKVLGACGDGGFITTRDQNLAERLRQMRNIGLKNRDEAARIGGNSRLDSIQAAILLAKFPYLDGWIKARNEHAKSYRSALPDQIQLPPNEEAVRCVYSAFVIRINEGRDRVQQALAAQGIDTKIHYPIPVHRQAPFEQFARTPLPVTERVAETILSLPCSPELTTEQRDTIIEQLGKQLD